MLSRFGFAIFNAHLSNTFVARFYRFTEVRLFRELVSRSRGLLSCIYCFLFIPSCWVCARGWCRCAL